ncbi:MAG: hypothetical protein HFG34_03030 [Eubacterium sp.]|nr:hypothetical protein [Eubacterium sp.]
MSKQKTCPKTSVNLPLGLISAYGGTAKKMKKSVLAIRPADFKDSALRTLFKKYKITVERGTKNLWENQRYFDEIFSLLFPKAPDKMKREKVSLHLTPEQKLAILKLSGEETLTKGFFRLLLLDYAKKSDMAKVNISATTYCNLLICKANKESAHTDSCYTSNTSSENKTSADTGLKVHGNKKWFLNNFNEILQSLSDDIDTFVEPCMGSGIITLTACQKKCFKRIITNDIYWHKANYLRSFIFKSDELKAACLSLSPDQKTYNEAKEIIEKFRSSSTDEILPDIAAKYLFCHYCNNSRGGLNPNNLIENNENAICKYRNYLDCLWNTYRSAQKVIIHNEDALHIIKKHNRKKNLLFVDPPYPKTKGYETEFTIEDFETLAEDVIHYNGSLIFCCRITNKKEKIFSQEDAYNMDDLHIKHIIDNSFLGHGLYYRDYPYNIGGVAIERVITNFPFKGCYHYDTEQPWQEK